MIHTGVKVFLDKLGWQKHLAMYIHNIKPVQYTPVSQFPLTSETEKVHAFGTLHLNLTTGTSTV